MKLRLQEQAGLNQTTAGEEKFMCKGPGEERAQGMRAPEKQASRQKWRDWRVGVIRQSLGGQDFHGECNGKPRKGLRGSEMIQCAT